MDLLLPLVWRCALLLTAHSITVGLEVVPCPASWKREVFSVCLAPSCLCCSTTALSAEICQDVLTSAVLPGWAYDRVQQKG